MRHVASRAPLSKPAITLLSTFASSINATVTNRVGAVSAMVIVVLLVLAGMIAAQVRVTIMERRQMRHEFEYQQVERLAEAGVLLVNSKASEPEWSGTTWEIPSGQIHQTNSGTVQISIQPDRTWTVTARYPANTEYPFQVTRTGKLKP